MKFRPDYYKILQVDQGASQEIITAAYNELLSKNSPQNNHNQEFIDLVMEAYAVIGNPQDRFMYDSWLDANESDSHQILVTTPTDKASNTNTTEQFYQQAPELSVIDAYKFGFEIIAKQPVITLYVFGFILLLGSLSLLTNLYNWQDQIYTNPILVLLYFLVLAIFLMILSMLGFSIMGKIILNIFDNKEIRSYGLTSVRKIANLVGYLILFSLILVFGFMLLIIPGIIFYLRLSPGLYLIVDEDLGVSDALKKSWQITKGFMWKIFLFFLLFMVLSSLGFLFSFIGNGLIIVAISILISPILFFSMAYFYRSLLYQTHPYDYKDIKTNAYAYDHTFLNGIPIYVLIIVVSILFVINLYLQNNYLNNYQPNNSNYIYSTKHSNPITANLTNEKTIQYPVIKTKINKESNGIPYPLEETQPNTARITIPNVGTIDIDNSLEIQNEAWRQAVESYTKDIGAVIPEEMQSDITIQQKGLDKYCRIIVMTIYGERGDYEPLISNYTATKEEMNEISRITKPEIIKISSFIPGMKILEIYPPRLENINGMTALVLSYRRQLNDNPPVLVWEYRFQHNDRLVILSMSYRETETNEWKPIFENCLKSFRITNIIT